MKPVPFALFALALAVALAWPLTSALGIAASRTSAAALRPASCSLDGTATPSGDDGAETDADAPALPPGHPSIAGDLPPGHPPIDLPPGHPPIGRALPPGHPPIPSGHGGEDPSMGDLFGEPILLTI